MKALDAPKQLHSWNNEDILLWLSEIGFGAHSERFKVLNITGKALVELQHMRNVDPVGFYSFIQNDTMFSFHADEVLPFGFEMSKLAS